MGLNVADSDVATKRFHSGMWKAGTTSVLTAPPKLEKKLDTHTGEEAQAMSTKTAQMNPVIVRNRSKIAFNHMFDRNATVHSALINTR